MRYQFSEISPENTIFAILSFEGPDRYALAGGLGVRVSELSEALAQAGFETHLFFVGAPDRPEHESDSEGRRHLWRCCQRVSARYTAGVYQGEDEKREEFNRTLPPLLLSQIARPAEQNGKLLVILGEDWHTAEAMCNVSDLLYWQGLRNQAILLWNANSIFGFERIDWTRLQVAARITTVSRYMKQLLWAQGVNALVIHNGIPDRHLETVPIEPVHQLRTSLSGRLILTKFARFDPDKNWIPAVQAVARLRALGHEPLLIMRGGIEAYGMKVFAEITNLGLRQENIMLEQPTIEEFLADIQCAQSEADVLFCRFFVPEAIQRVLYRASHAVLANSGHEPFGLVGLEVMAAQGLAFVGSTGEDYAQHLLNAISMDTNDPNEVVGNLLYLQHHTRVAEELRRVGRITARFYVWPRIIGKLVSKLQYLLMTGGTSWPRKDIGP